MFLGEVTTTKSGPCLTCAVTDFMSAHPTIRKNIIPIGIGSAAVLLLMIILRGK